MEKIQSFAVENGISVDIALKAVQLAFFIVGMMTFHLIEETLKSSLVKKFLSYLRSRFSSRDDTSSDL